MQTPLVLARPNRSLCAALLAALALAACGEDDEGSNNGDGDEDTGRDVSRDFGDRPDTSDEGGDDTNEDGGESDGTLTDTSVDASADTSEDTAGGTAVGPTGDETDPACVDGLYREVPPDSTISLAAEEDSYSAGAAAEFISAVLDKRYPVGAYIFENGITHTSFFDCLEFLQDTSSAEAVIGELSTIVHECGHAFNDGVGTFEEAAYVITADLEFHCSGGSMNDTFARSLITGDEYADLRPACDCCGQGCDFYATLYLDGDPEDGEFDSGDQGFDSVLEEATQYVNSLATAHAFADYVDGFVSERDGILTFLWYIERYLHMARLEYPDTYATLSEDECWRDAILTVWGRAWLMLELSADEPQLALDDEALLELVRDPDLLDEIDRLRDAASCP